jgi:ribosomal protein L40E
LVKQVAEMKVIRMQVGADDYLADSFQNEFADATVDRFQDLGNLLSGWNEEAVRLSKSRQDSVVAATTLSDKDADVRAEQQPTAIPVSTPPESNISAPKSKEETKFCLFCGTQLPAVATFCSSCGKKQDV